MHTIDSNIKFAICIAAKKDSDLEAWKIYRVLPDTKAAEVECLRVIDESGEDYLYPQKRFVIVELSKEVQERLLATIENR